MNPAMHPNCRFLDKPPLPQWIGVSGIPGVGDVFILTNRTEIWYAWRTFGYKRLPLWLNEAMAEQWNHDVLWN